MPPSSLSVRSSLPARSVPLLAALLSTLALVAAALTPAAAIDDPEPEETCLFISLFEGDGTPVSAIQQGSERDLYFFIGPGSAAFCASLDGTVIETVSDLAEDVLVRIALIDASGELLPSEGFFLRPDPEGDLEPFSSTESADTLFVFDRDDWEGGIFVVSLPFTATADTPTGDFFLSLSVIQGIERAEANDAENVPAEDELLVFISSPFTITAAPAPAPTTTLTCDTNAPVVGSTVTCELRSDPEVDFLWRASTNPEFATGVVTTGADGLGTLSFVVPASVAGEELFVEIVEWLEPRSIGTATGPVPTSVPSGEGPAPILPSVLLLALFGAAAIGSRSALRARG